jgi:molybdopterin synthase sulfur carrier subunit
MDHLMDHEVWIPALHRDLTGGVEQVKLAGSTVRELVEELDARFPGLADRLCDGERLRPGIHVAVNGVVEPKGLRVRLAEASEVHFVPAIGGG